MTTESINIGMTWEGVADILATVLIDGTPQGQSEAKAELKRMAQAADRAVMLDKALRDLAPNPWQDLQAGMGYDEWAARHVLPPDTLAPQHDQRFHYLKAMNGPEGALYLVHKGGLRVGEIYQAVGGFTFKAKDADAPGPEFPTMGDVQFHLESTV